MNTSKLFKDIRIFDVLYGGAFVIILGVVSSMVGKGDWGQACFMLFVLILLTVGFLVEWGYPYKGEDTDDFL